jgi:hypothetical protein
MLLCNTVINVPLPQTHQLTFEWMVWHSSEGWIKWSICSPIKSLSGLRCGFTHKLHSASNIHLLILSFHFRQHWDPQVWQWSWEHILRAWISLTEQSYMTVNDSLTLKDIMWKTFPRSNLISFIKLSNQHSNLASSITFLHIQLWTSTRMDSVSRSMPSVTSISKLWRHQTNPLWDLQLAVSWFAPWINFLATEWSRWL